MRAVWFHFLSAARRQWVSWLALAFVCALATSLSLAAAGDARRAWSALPRALEAGAVADADVSADETAISPQDANAFLDRIEHLDTVESSTRWGGVLLAVVNNGELDRRLVLSSALGKLVDDRATTVDRLSVLHGRLPESGHPEEIVVNPTVLQITGWHIGDTVTSVRLFRLADLDENQGPIPTKGTQLSLRIVGEVRRPDELLSDSSTRPPQIYLFPDFAKAYPDSTFYVGSSVRWKPQTDPAKFGDAVAAVAADYPNNQTFVTMLGPKVSVVRTSLRPQIVAVWLLAAVLFFAGVFIAAQMVGRQLLARHRDLPDLYAIGMTRNQLGIVVLLHAAAVAIAAAIFSALIGYASSAVTPFGSTHAIEPHPGLRLDGAVVMLGAGAVIAALLVVAAVTAWRLARLATQPSTLQVAATGRPSRITELLARLGAGPAVMTGARFAVHRGRGRNATPVRSVIGGIVLATAAVTLALGYSSSLDHLIHTPRLYGWDWDVAVRNDFGSIPDEAVSGVRDRPEVGALAGYTVGQLRIESHDVPAIGIDEIQGTVYPTLDEGRIAESDQELVLGRRTLAEIHRSLGDSVSVVTPAGTKTMKIVGIATFSAVGQHRGISALGHGAATVASVFPPDDPAFGGHYNGLLIRIAHGVDKPAAIATLRTFAAETGCDDTCFTLDARPGELSGYAGLTNLWIPFLVVLGLLLVISLIHGLVSATRANRRDLAIMAALGFGRRQITAVVVWQAAIIALVALAVAIPAGLIAAAAGWSIFIHPLGIQPPAQIPGLALVAVAAGTITAALVVGVGCAFPARRGAVIKALVND